MSFKVVNTFYEPGRGYREDLLEPLGATLVNGRWFTEDELIANTQDAAAVICASPIQSWTARVLMALPKCRIIATQSIGYERIPMDTAAKMVIAVTNIPDYCIDEVSSQAIALIMALSRKLFPIDKAVKEKQVFLNPGNRKGLNEIGPVFRMRGQTLGIIGLGKIGTTVALKAKGLGLRVIAYDPYVYEAVMYSHGVEPTDLDRLVRESDFISINAALTDETRGMIGPGQFKKMKPTCYLVNTARGEIIQQPALVEALKGGLIAGAGLDVTVDEPIAADNPLLKLPNVILTGHAAWYSTLAESDAEFWHKPMGQVAMALKGQWPSYAVNPGLKQKWLEKWTKNA
jgi:D-3-phosphoglycerate dehydrogenase / 2-oxoglutarate reductase